MMAESEMGRAQARALRLLTARGRSKAELRQRLQQAGFSSQVVEETVAWCTRLGYLDDARFASDWIEYRSLHSPSGRRRLLQELRQKGVADEIIVDALEAQLPRELEARLCVELAAGQVRRYARLNPETRRRRLISFLQRRGFRYEDIRNALNEVDTFSDTD